MYRSQSLARYFSCVRMIQTSSILLQVGETVSASPHRSPGMTPFTCSTSYTCRKAVPPGPPFGRRAQQVCGPLVEKLTSLKVFLSPLFTLWITDVCTSPPCRFQFEYGKPSNSTYFSGLLDASRQPAHADWVSYLSVLTLGSFVSETIMTELPSPPIVVPLPMDVPSISPTLLPLTAQNLTTKEEDSTSCPILKHTASRSGTGHVFRFQTRSFGATH
jgi:hypothetical protein